MQICWLKVVGPIFPKAPVSRQKQVIKLHSKCIGGECLQGFKLYSLDEFYYYAFGFSSGIESEGNPNLQDNMCA